MSFKVLIHKTLGRMFFQCLILFFLLPIVIFVFRFILKNTEINGIYSIYSFSLFKSVFWMLLFIGITVIVTYNALSLIKHLHSELKYLLENCYNHLHIDSGYHTDFLISEIDEINNCFFKYKEKLYKKFSSELNQRNEFMFLTSHSYHDLKSLITLTQGNIELLAVSDLNKEQRGYLDDIRSASDDSMNFIDNLLLYLNALCLERYNTADCPIQQLLDDIKLDTDVMIENNVSKEENSVFESDQNVRIYINETLLAVQIAINCLQEYTNNRDSRIQVDICPEDDVCIFSIKNMGKPFTKKVLAQYTITSARRCICDNANESRFIIKMMYVKKIFEMDRGSMQLVNFMEHPKIVLQLPLL